MWQVDYTLHERILINMIFIRKLKKFKKSNKFILLYKFTHKGKTELGLPSNTIFTFFCLRMRFADQNNLIAFQVLTQEDNSNI